MFGKKFLKNWEQYNIRLKRRRVNIILLLFVILTRYCRDVQSDQRKERGGR